MIMPLISELSLTCKILTSNVLPPPPIDDMGGGSVRKIDD
jgi:hypothetical protein